MRYHVLTYSNKLFLTCPISPVLTVVTVPLRPLYAVTELSNQPSENGQNVIDAMGLINQEV